MLCLYGFSEGFRDRFHDPEIGGKHLLCNEFEPRLTAVLFKPYFVSLLGRRMRPVTALGIFALTVRARIFLPFRGAFCGAFFERLDDPGTVFLPVARSFDRCSASFAAASISSSKEVGLRLDSEGFG